MGGVKMDMALGDIFLCSVFILLVLMFLSIGTLIVINYTKRYFEKLKKKEEQQQVNQETLKTKEDKSVDDLLAEANFIRSKVDHLLKLVENNRDEAAQKILQADSHLYEYERRN
jgi:Spy/CpxP family protein refolding chaperone